MDFACVNARLRSKYKHIYFKKIYFLKEVLCLTVFSVLMLRDVVDSYKCVGETHRLFVRVKHW